jgi:Arc/MetJ family transcription regulator
MHMAVYAGVEMSRTNIDIDDRLIGKVMQMHGLATKREAVDFALRELLGGPPMTLEETLAMQGTGWGGNLDEMHAPYDPWAG